MIHVYTGDGKGKTTAAFGLALRAAGHGKKVRIIQFMKGCPEYGEIAALKKLASVSIEQFGGKDRVDRCSPSKEDIVFAKSGLDAATEALGSGTCDMLVLDEVNIALDFGLIELADILCMLKTCPEQIEIILTGRNAPAKLLEIADYVTEMREIKHPYTRGIEQRKGIEF